MGRRKGGGGGAGGKKGEYKRSYHIITSSYPTNLLTEIMYIESTMTSDGR